MSCLNKTCLTFKFTHLHHKRASTNIACSLLYLLHLFLEQLLSLGCTFELTLHTVADAVTCAPVRLHCSAILNLNACGQCAVSLRCLLACPQLTHHLWIYCVKVELINFVVDCTEIIYKTEKRVEGKEQRCQSTMLPSCQ